MTAPACWQAAPTDAPALAQWLSVRPLWRLAALVRALADPSTQIWCTGARRPHPSGALWLQTAGDYVDVCDVFVAPEGRRRGAGRALVTSAVAAAERMHAMGVTLEVAVDNTAAIALYHQLGFVTLSVRHGYYESSVGRVDALLMSRSCRTPNA